MIALHCEHCHAEIARGDDEEEARAVACESGAHFHAERYPEGDADEHRLCFLHAGDCPACLRAELHRHQRAARGAFSREVSP